MRQNYYLRCLNEIKEGKKVEEAYYVPFYQIIDYYIMNMISKSCSLDESIRKLVYTRKTWKIVYETMLNIIDGLTMKLLVFEDVFTSISDKLI